MIPDVSSASALVVLVTPILLLLMLLPTILELKKPSDAGPRLIMGNFSGVITQTALILSIANIEENQEFGVNLARPIGSVFGFLSNLDA
jgi:hypothetical protein